MGKVIIKLDERWDLEDFAVMSKEYLQLYGFFYGSKYFRERPNVSSSKSDFAQSEETDKQVGFSSLPWEGGHSVVHFFRATLSGLTEHERPIVKRIQYASPGFMELSVLTEIALQVSALVGAISGSIFTANKTYDHVMKTYRSREWAKLKADRLRMENNSYEIELIERQIKIMNKVMKLNDTQMENLSLMSGGDQLVQLKMMLAAYRRALPLAELEADGKANFSEANTD